MITTEELHPAISDKFLRVSVSKDTITLMFVMPHLIVHSIGQVGVINAILNNIISNWCMLKLYNKYTGVCSEELRNKQCIKLWLTCI